MAWPKGTPKDLATRRAISDGVKQAYRSRRQRVEAAARFVQNAIRWDEMLGADPRSVKLGGGVPAARSIVVDNLTDALTQLEPGDAPELRALIEDTLQGAGVSSNGAKSAAVFTGRKSAPSSYKARPSGRVEALVSIFNVVDLQGDRVLPGAFQKSIEKWKQSGDPLPVCYSHDWADPFSFIGQVADIRETEKGLWVAYELDLDSNPKAKQVYDLLRKRRIKDHSYSYDVVKSRPGADGATELVEVALIEVGPTLRGANPATELLGAKAAPATAPERTDADDDPRTEWVFDEAVREVRPKKRARLDHRTGGWRHPYDEALDREIEDQRRAIADLEARRQQRRK